MYERYWILACVIISYCVLFTPDKLPAALWQGVELGRWRFFQRLNSPGLPGLLCELWLIRHRRLPTKSVPRIVVVRWLDRARVIHVTNCLVNLFNYWIIGKMVQRPLIDICLQVLRPLIVIVPLGYRVKCVTHRIFDSWWRWFGLMRSWDQCGDSLTLRFVFCGSGTNCI